MDDKKEDGKCGKGCGLQCGCCTCKAIKGVVLRLIGGALGFWIGRCGGHRMCAVPSSYSTPADTAPMAPAPAPSKKAK